MGGRRTQAPWHTFGMCVLGGAHGESRSLSDTQMKVLSPQPPCGSNSEGSWESERGICVKVTAGTRMSACGDGGGTQSRREIRGAADVCVLVVYFLFKVSL